MRVWWVGVVAVMAVWLLAVVVLWPRAADGPERARDGPVADAGPEPEEHRHWDSGPSAELEFVGRAASGLSHSDVVEGMRAAPGQPSLADVLRLYPQVKMEYDRWFDAGLGPDQVEVVVIPNDRIATRISRDGFDDEPIAPGVMIPWDLLRRDFPANQAIHDMRALTMDRLNACLQAFAAKRGETLEGETLEDWEFRYVWRVQSRTGRGRVVVEVEPAWWPALFDADDRACYRAALEDIARLEFITDTHDFNYRVEVTDYLPMEEP